ncbi:MAG: ABC transporter ATP-binding protein [Actinomycetota bacterium]|nr:ABC transporter ATP-binding protein [Actinomycetota bacterium]
MAPFELDISLALRTFRLELGLSAERETVALVGPSGAGKTTVLRAVAGLQRPEKGRIACDGRTWFDSDAGVDLPPEARSVGLVFQEYALFPHMTVRANVAFGGADRADELLERFHISHLAGERPHAISGGERQRVALARAIARAPAILLLDEPLAALDTHTRTVVRDELQDLLAELPIPALLVTHDFRDATTLADRIGVIVDGRLRQLGTPQGLIARPADAFVATFTGGNLLSGVARLLPGGGSGVTLEDGVVVRSDERAEGRIGVAIYPWEVGVALAAPPDGGLNAIPGTIHGLAREGGRIRLRVGDLTAECSPEEAERLALADGARVYATFAPAGARLVR